MKLQSFFTPLFVAAAVITVYLLFKQQEQPVSAVTPNPASSGITTNYTLGGVVQPAAYNVPPIVQPTNNQVSLLPASAAPAGGGPAQVPAYLTFNLGPQNNLAAAPNDAVQAAIQAASAPSGSCGCSGKKDSCRACKTSNSFVDGSNPTPIASSKAAAINSTPNDQINAAWENLMNYLQTESPSAIPSLTSYQPSADLGGNPTNGTAYQMPESLMLIQ